MDSFSRKKAITAVANGRAQILDLRTWAKASFLDGGASRSIHAIVFPKAKAISEAKLGYGRGTKGILRRDKFVCQFVGCSRRATTVDHVKPRCQGGPSTWSNLVAACLECNQRKAGRTPDQAGMALKRPVQSRRADLLQRFHELAGTA
jgi:hypothetical protein